MTSINVSERYSTNSDFKEHVQFELKPADIWNNLLKKVDLKDHKFIWTTQFVTSNNYQLALRCANGLRIFRYSQRSDSWQQVADLEPFSDRHGFHKTCYPLQFWRTSQIKNEILIARTQDGFCFFDYDVSNQVIRFLSHDGLFPDSSRWYDERNQLEWGHFYGPDKPLGLFTRHTEEGVRFYLLNPNGFSENERPIWNDCTTNENIQSIFENNKEDRFIFADITGSGQTNIIRQNQDGLSVHGFEMTQNGFVLKKIIQTDLCSKTLGWRPGQDKLWFVRLTKTHLSNLVLLQSDGLRVYQYDEGDQRFRCLQHDPSFAEQRGWTKEHCDSMFFVNFDGNSFMKLICTGPRGLAISSFNPNIYKWENNLNTGGLNLEYRYATPVMLIPSEKSPTQIPILILKQHRQLCCLAINKTEQKILIAEQNIEQLSSTNINSSKPKELATTQLQPRLIPPIGECIIPSKTPALLRNTLDIKPLLSAVNTYTGKLSFTLPLVTCYSGLNGLQMKLALLYQGADQHASVCGVGWKLVEDYFGVDYQESIDPLAHQYFWITSHGIVSLVRQDSWISHVQKFRLSTSYDLYLFRSLNEHSLPDIKKNAIVLVGPFESHNYDAYRVENNQWLSDNESNHLKKTLIRNIDDANLGSIEQNGLIKMTDSNIRTIVKVIQMAISNENYVDMNITYYLDEQRWEMTTIEGEKRIYGVDAVAWTIGWTNWLGIGSDTTHQKRYPVRWHRKETQAYGNEKILYSYKTIECQVGNQSFTRSMYLKSISDSNNDNRIDFYYERKSIEECQEPALNDSDGNIKPRSTFTDFLTTIKIMTRVNFQTIEFKYSLQHGMRQLIAISQQEDPLQRPILAFAYKSFHNSIQINEISLPNEDKLRFVYQENELKYKEGFFDSYSGRYIVKRQAQLTTGPDYLIMSEIDERALCLKILQINENPIADISVIPDVCSYQTFARQDYFLFLVKTYDDRRALFLYHRRSSSQWFLEPKRYSISELKVHWADQDLIVVNSEQEILIINWNYEKKIWQEKTLHRPSNVQRKSEIFLAANRSLIAVYDDRQIWIGYRDSNRQWQVKTLKTIPGYFSQSKDLLNRFDINPSLSENVLDCIKSHMLQCQNNIILLTTWNEENSKLKSSVSIFLLDANYNIYSEETESLQEESINEIFSKPQEQEFIKGDKITYRFVCQKYQGKIRAIFEPQKTTTDFTQKGDKYHRVYQLSNQELTVTIQGIKEFVIYNKHTGEWFTSMAQDLHTESQSLNEYFQGIFLVDVTKYFPILTPNQIVCNYKKWSFTGHCWQEKATEGEIADGNKFVYPLGEEYVLYKANKEASFKLFEQDAKGERTEKCLFDFNVKSLEDICNRYPTYIAYKQNNNRIMVLPFKMQRKLGNAYHLREGNLTPWSNSKLLMVSECRIRETDDQIVFIYSNPEQSESYFDPVVVETDFEIEYHRRSNGYRYHRQSAEIINDIAIYRTIETIPGNDRSRHGWIEDRYESNNGSRHYFNSQGQEILLPNENIKNASAIESKAKSDTAATMFIQNTKIEIAEFYNASIINDEAAYFGFESYEIDNASKWNYQRQDLIKDDWPLTGEYCLRLKNQKHCLRRTFNPKNQNCSYQAACWIRGINANAFVTDEFKAIIKTGNRDVIGILPAHSSIHQGDWHYLEININLPEIRKYGALTPIYSVDLHNRRYVFQEDTNSVHDEQDEYGFMLLGMTRSQAAEQLLANAANFQIRSLVAPEIAIAFRRGALPEVMTCKPNYQKICTKLREHKKQVDQTLVRIKEALGLNHQQQLDFADLLEYIKSQPKHKTFYDQLKTMKLAADEIENDIENYSKEQSTFQSFIENFASKRGWLCYLANMNGRQTRPSIFDAITELNNICFYIWKQIRTNNQLTLLHTNKERVTKPQQILHLLYREQSVQFQKLLDITHQHESLKQGHEYLIIDLIVQPASKSCLDIDHIRFSPRDQQFFARVYNSQTYQVTSLIDGAGSIKYMFYNGQNQHLAVTDWKKYVKELSIHGKRGQCVTFGSTLAHEQPRSQLQIKPKHGFYEDFSSISFLERWIVDVENVWTRTLGRLSHVAESTDSLRLTNEWLDENSAGLHVQLEFKSIGKVEIHLHRHMILVESINKNYTKLIVNRDEITMVPQSAEYLIITDANRLWIWINGQLQIDKGFSIDPSDDNNIRLSLRLTGHVFLGQLFIFSQCSIDVVYKNILDEELQTIQLESSQSAIVCQTLYDDLGRQVITTKPTRIIVGDNEPLLAFRKHFVENETAGQHENVWQTGKLNGVVNKFNSNDEGFCYFEVKYADNPLNDKTAIGQPGRLFSANAAGSAKYNRGTCSSLINLLFPQKDGYIVQECIQPHGTKDITVFDERRNRRARYVETTSSTGLLTTYEYDEDNRLVNVLHPAYHAHRHIDTLSQTEPYKNLANKWKNNEETRILQNKFGITMIYDKHGQLIERVSPDANKQKLFYSNEKLLRFILQHDSNGKPCRVIYYEYNQWGALCSQGYSMTCLSEDDLQNLANSYEELPQAIPYSQISSSSSLSDANFRGKLVSSVVNQSGGLWTESSCHTEEGKLSTKEIIVRSDQLWHTYRLDYTYFGEYTTSITYPFIFQNQPLVIVYSRNKQDRIAAIGTLNNPERWAKFDYTACGLVSNEIHVKNNFTTSYGYNSPGYVEYIRNRLFEETIYYTEGSYGQEGFFDGTVARTQFKAKWFNYCNSQLLSLTADAVRHRLEVMGHRRTSQQVEYYLQRLEDVGVLDRNRYVVKALLPLEAAAFLPRECEGTFSYALAEILNEYFTEDYGHQYAYGHHMELTKAKYIIGDRCLGPIRPCTFNEKINKISLKDSEAIWNILVDHIYIWPDNDDGLHLQGKVYANKWIDYDRLKKNLGELSDYYHILATVLQKFISLREYLTFDKFQRIFLKWLSVNEDTQQKTISNYLQVAKQIWTMLSTHKYLYSENETYALFKQEIYDVLKEYRTFIPEIVAVLREYSLIQTGESDCDVEAYEIDENGNHRHYWTGYSRYQLHYRENNNQIEKINYKSISRIKSTTNLEIRHDSLGNVTKAEHKGITEIIYNPATNRPTTIRLEDGRQVLFDYDIRGERVRKYVMNKNGEKLREILYIRDDQGRSLVEKEIYFTESGHNDEQHTAYIYGPKGLIGFIRNDEFYSVICDHEGSVRLIVKDHEVVAAYDYLPYGHLIRQYGIAEAQISYRYTGQEWDEETGLYNYHTRLYDPDIGRFYQIDPREQYASPYKYAGNSPVSMIDPDGEWAVLVAFMVGLGLLGLYLGGAAANQNWCPWEWDLKKGSTYLGIFGGAVAGALLPLGFSASVSAMIAAGLGAGYAIAITTFAGLVGTYLGMAAANHSWSPIQWKWSRPMTWSGGFLGFAFGSSIFGGIGAWNSFYQSLTAAGQTALISVSGSASLASLYLGLACANNSFNPGKWEFTPATLMAGLGGALGGFLIPVGIVGAYNFVSSLKGIQFVVGLGVLGAGVIVVPYLFCSALNNSFNILKWDFTSPQIYEAILSGILLGISLPGIPKALRLGIKFTRDFWACLRGKFELVGHRGVAKVVAKGYADNHGQVKIKPTPEHVRGDVQLGEGVYVAKDKHVAVDYAHGSAINQAEYEKFFERYRPEWLNEAGITDEALVDMRRNKLWEALHKIKPEIEYEVAVSLVDNAEACREYLNGDISEYASRFKQKDWSLFGEVMDVYARDFQKMTTNQEILEYLGPRNINTEQLAELSHLDYIQSYLHPREIQFKFSLNPDVLVKLKIIPHGASLDVCLAGALLSPNCQLPKITLYSVLFNLHMKNDQ